MCGRPLFQCLRVTKHLLQHTLSHTLHLVSTVGQGDHPTPHQAQFQRCWMLICSFVSDLLEEPFMIIHGGHMLYCEPSYCPTWHQQKLRNLQIFLLIVWLRLVPLQSIPVHCINVLNVVSDVIILFTVGQPQWLSSSLTGGGSRDRM